MIQKFECFSEEQTKKLGYNLAKTLKAGDVCALYADIGCGKTVITKGIAEYFNLSANSPTFTLVNEYIGKIPIYHFDAYRITANDWLDSGFDEYLFGNGICIIEWAENVSEILPKNCIKITIKKDLTKGDDYRLITIEGEVCIEAFGS